MVCDKLRGMEYEIEDKHNVIFNLKGILPKPEVNRFVLQYLFALLDELFYPMRCEQCRNKPFENNREVDFNCEICDCKMSGNSILIFIGNLL